jgi:hypothetical protein
MTPATYWKDGKEYYVFIVHPQQERIFRQYGAEDSAGLAARAAGRNWRRVKREMRKAGLAWKRANPVRGDRVA